MTNFPAISRSFIRPAGVLVRCALVAFAVLLAGSFARAQIIPSEMPAPVRGLEVANHLGQQIPLHLQFVDEQGKIISLSEYFNRKAAAGGGGSASTKKPVIVQLMYYRCPILCPEVLKRLTSTLNDVDFTIGKDFDVLLVSIDPTDTPAAAARHKAEQLIAYNRSGDAVTGGWNFLTSPSADTPRQLADALGFPYRYAAVNNEFSHGAALFVLTPEGKVSRYLLGLNYPAADVRLALLEASGGKIGTVFDSFTLWCYHFDPDSGTYKLGMGVMRTGALLTLVLLGGLLFTMWRFERRKARRAAPAAASPASGAPSNPASPDLVEIPHEVFGAQAPFRSDHRPQASSDSPVPPVSAMLTGSTR